MRGICEAVTVAAQEIVPSPVKLCDPAVTDNPVHYTRTEEIGAPAPQMAGLPDDLRRLFDVSPFPAVPPDPIRQNEPIVVLP